MPDWPDGEMRLRAYLLTESSSIDITNSADWHLDNTQHATVVNGVVHFTLDERVLVWVTLGGLDSDIYGIQYSSLPDMSTSQSSQSNDPPVSSTDIEQGAYAIENYIDESGVPTGELELIIGLTAFKDNAACESIVGTPLDCVPSGKSAMFYPNGPSREGAIFIWCVNSPHIVVEHDIAVTLRDGQITTGNGNLTSGATDTFHELLQSVIYHNNISVSRNNEERIVSDFAQFILPNLVSAVEILNKPHLSHIDKWRLRYNLLNIKKILNKLRAIDADAVDGLLEKLGWDDADGDGIIDFIEDLLEQKELELESLPTSPIEPTACIDPDEVIDPASPTAAQKADALGLSLGRHISHLRTFVTNPCGDYFVECDCGIVFTNLE